MINELTLEKLQWSLLCEALAAEANTIEGNQSCLTLKPRFDKLDIELRWQDVLPLRDLLRSGYRPPIGELPEMHLTFRAVSLGQILEGEAIWSVYTLLQMVRSVHQFAMDKQERCKTLGKFYRLIHPLPKLARMIEKTISPDGDLLDDASPELTRIRQQKLSMRRKIEQTIKQLLTDQDVEAYVQDKIFTIRSDRYVVPMRVDGRGRVKGSIYDTSSSGQTLYMELAEVRPMNDALLELESSEKLEILRIFKELSAHIATDLEVIDNNYKQLVELDILTAEAALAVKLDAGSAVLRNKPGLSFIRARHPLLEMRQDFKTIANNVGLEEGQLSLIVSGPNAGGKTVVLKTVGLLHLMVKARLLLPLDEKSEVYLFDNIFVEIGDAQNLSANLSTFSGHLIGLKPVLLNAGPTDLILLDELAVGTEPQTGSAIGQAVLEELANRQSTAIVTTHYDNLKSLAINDTRFRNGSMEFSTKNLQPTYRLVLDIPGQSYGLEVAEQIGLPRHVIERAKDLRGRSSSNMEQILDSWMALRDEAQEEKTRYNQLKLDMESQKHRWEQDRAALANAKQDTSAKIKARYQDQIDRLKQEYEGMLEELKELLKEQKKAPSSPDQLRDLTKDWQNRLDGKNRGIQGSLEDVAHEFFSVDKLPGRPAAIGDLKEGSRVYIVSMQKAAVVSKVQGEPNITIEVKAGLLKIKPQLADLRILGDEKPELTKGKSKDRTKSTVAPTRDKGEVSFTIPTLTNSLDLRGMDADGAIDRTWGFIDKAVLRGESFVILIHGHGTDTLKRALRRALAKDAPYALDFRPGEPEEGGDGVTVVQLRH
ncbi:MAG: Smr/MutS family protein [Chitinophagaceae bacterium]|nr:Smr/MutS family protein [Oligoflexus sp.]